VPDCEVTGVDVLIPERVSTRGDVDREPVRPVHLWDAKLDAPLPVPTSCGAAQDADEHDFGCSYWVWAGHTYCPNCFRPICTRCIGEVQRRRREQ